VAAACGSGLWQRPVAAACGSGLWQQSVAAVCGGGGRTLRWQQQPQRPPTATRAGWWRWQQHSRGLRVTPASDSFTTRFLSSACHRGGRA
jgi:hypothetical protein